MASIRFTATVRVAAPISTVWATATDWPAHSRWVPLTTVRVLQDRGGMGTTFVGRTAIGPLGFDDPMTVTLWQPPSTGGSTAQCTVAKTGRVLVGTAGFTLATVDDSVTRIDWFENVDITPRWLTRLFAPVIASVLSRGLRDSMRKLARDAARVTPR